MALEEMRVVFWLLCLSLVVDVVIIGGRTRQSWEGHFARTRLICLAMDSATNQIHGEGLNRSVGLDSLQLGGESVSLHV